MYGNGEGVAKDDAEAVKGFRKAADQGNASAQFNLGMRYDNGRGVAENDAQAVRWYRKAADQGNADAQNHLGVMYANGLGVPRSYAQAAKWFRKAADQGKRRGARPSWCTAPGFSDTRQRYAASWVVIVAAIQFRRVSAGLR